MVGSLVLRSIAEAVTVSVVVLASLTVVTAQVRTSPNYQIQSDSINVGGGLGTSANYVLEDTIGEVATGPISSANYSLRGGYQQMQEVFISMSAPGDVVMDTVIPGLTGGIANGSTTVTVVTDSPAGYQVTIAASATPAMRKGVDTIADYVPVANPNADFSFTTNSGQVHFGFSPTGINTVSAFRNNGSACGVGIITTPLRCWRGLTTSSIEIVRSQAANHPSGATTTLQFRVGHGGNVSVPAGSYVATTTLTALPL